VLRYYRLSLCQLALAGVARIMHFEISCRALGHEPSLAMFRRFFQLARNGNWFTIEKTQIEVGLISATVGLSSSWKDRFFFVSSDIIPFPACWRKPDESLNEKVPYEASLDQSLLSKLRVSTSRLRTFPEEFLVKLGISERWDEAGLELIVTVEGKGMLLYSFLLLVFFAFSLFPPFLCLFRDFGC
jgi:hypothetical protein